jgi:hypothetical protein
VTIDDVVLKPGDNVFPMKGVLDIRTIFKNLGDVLKAQASALKNGSLAIDSITRSVEWKGTPVDYYAEVLKTLTLSTEIPLGDTIKNTLKNLLHGKNLTSALSGLLGDSSLSSRSLSDHDRRGPVDLAPFLKNNRHVQDFFSDSDIDTDQRDIFINAVAAAYPNI